MKFKKRVVKSIACILAAVFVLQTGAMAKSQNPEGSDSSIKNKPKYTTTRIIVKYNENADKSKIKNKVKLKRLNPFMNSKGIKKSENLEVIDTGSTGSVDSMIADFEEIEGVEYAVPDYKLEAYTSVSDMLNSQPGSAGIAGASNISGSNTTGTNPSTIQGNIIQPETADKNISEENDGEDSANSTALENSSNTNSDALTAETNEENSKAAENLAFSVTAPAVDYEESIAAARKYSDGSGILVGVLDTGIDISHEVFNGRIYKNQAEIADNGIDDDGNGLIDDVNGYNFTGDNGDIYDSPQNDSHGTNVAGIIAENAPGATIVPLKFMNGSTGYTSDAIAAIDYAKSIGVKVMNVSWGCTEDNLALKNAITNANMLFVCASGNINITNLSYPAAFSVSNVISVGSMKEDGTPAEYSSTIDTPEIYAEGSDVYTAGCGGVYDTVSGTSFAAPKISAVAALAFAAVPEASGSQIKIVLKESVGRTAGNLKAVNPEGAVLQTLPLKLLNEADARFGRIMTLLDKSFTSDVAGILLEKKYFTELSGSELASAKAFFGISDEELSDISGAGLDIVDTVIALLSAQKSGLPAETVVALISEMSPETFDAEIQGYKNFTELYELTAADRMSVISLMTEGNKILDIIKAFIVSKALNLSLAQIIGYEEGSAEESIRIIAEEYNVKAQILCDYARNNNVSSEKILQDLGAWQNDNKLFVGNSEVTAYSYSANEPALFHRYQVVPGDSWAYGNAQVNQLNGTLQYTQPLLSLAGKHGLNLNLSLRFDSTVADEAINANMPDNLQTVYQLKEFHEYYDGLTNARVSSKDTTTVTDISEILADAYKTVGVATVQDGAYYYKKYYNITTKVTDTTSNPFAKTGSNFYESRYKLGVGIALDLPLLEISGTTKYIHLPGGQKLVYYQKADLTYAFAGYPINDITFGAAISTDFTYSNLTSAYVFTTLDKTKYYFDSTGKYLGCKNALGDHISVEYNSDGFIDSMIDTAGRYIKFLYNMDGSDRVCGVLLMPNEYDVLNYKVICNIYSSPNTNGTAYRLNRITDAAGRNTTFTFALYDSVVTFNDSLRTAYTNPTPTAVPITNQTLKLYNVKEPSGKITNITYNSTLQKTYYGSASTKQYMRVASLKTNYENSLSFSYGITNDLWQYNPGYIWYGIKGISTASSTSTTLYSVTNSSTSGSSKVKSSFNSLLQKTVEGLYKGIYKINESQYSSYLNGSPSVIISTSYNDTSASNANAGVVYTTMTTDSKGRTTEKTVKSGNRASNGSINTNDFTVDSREKYYYQIVQSINQAVPSTITKYTYKGENSSGNTVDFGTITYNYFTGSSGYNLIDHSITELYDLTNNNPIGDGISMTQYTYTGNIPTSVTSTDLIDGSSVTTDFESDGIYVTSQTVKDVGDYDYITSGGTSGTKQDITVSYDYDMFGRVLSQTDPLDNTTWYTYNNVGDITSVTYPDYTSTLYTYDYTNRIYSVTKDGITQTVIYDTKGNLTETKKTLPGSPDTPYTTALYEYDTLSRLTKETIPLESPYVEGSSSAKITDYTYDDLSRVTSVVVKKENGTVLAQTNTVYELGVNRNDSDTNKYDCVTTSVQKDSTGSTYTTKQYTDALGRVAYTDIVKENNDIVTTNNTYSAFNNLLKVEGSGAVNMDYSKSLRVEGTNTTTIESAAETANNNYGSSSTVPVKETVDGDGNVSYTIDTSENRTDYKYDKLGRLVYQSSPFEVDGNNTKYSESITYYNAAGQVIRTKTKNNATDAATKTWTETHYRHDNMGRQTYVIKVNASNDVYADRYVYNADGTLMKTITGIHGTSVSQVVNLLSVSSTGVVTGSAPYKAVSYTYDEQNNLISTTTGEGGNTGYASNTVTETRTVNPITGLMTSKSLPNGTQYSYTYDYFGRLTQCIASKPGNSVPQNFTYNMAGQLITANEGYIGGTMTYTNMSFEYNAKGECVSKYTTVSLNGTARSRKETYEYNSLGLETDYKLYTGSSYNVLAQSKVSEYDSNGNLQSVEDEKGFRATYLRDVGGRLYKKLISCPEILGLTTQTYSYNRAGLTTNTKRYQGLENYNADWVWSQNCVYKFDGNMISDAATSRSFDTSGNLISGSETTRTVSYAYDNIGRLKSESGSSGNKTYGYDNWDNLTSVNTANSLIEEFSYNNSNRLMVKSNQTPAGSMINTTYYTYDNAGNRVESETFNSSYTSINDITYTYDAMNRMTSYQSVTPSGTALTSYSYDAMNRRATKTSGSSRTDYVYDSNGSVCYERKTSNDTSLADIQYLCGLWTEGVTTSDTGSGTSRAFAFYVHNAQGDVVAKAAVDINSQQSFYNPAVTTTTYDAYGNVTGGTGDSVGYRNYYRDSESGMYYLNARYYDSSARSFTQQDPAKDGSNWYGYCSGNPVGRTDPTGMWYLDGYVAYKETGDNIETLAAFLYGTVNDDILKELTHTKGIYGAGYIDARESVDLSTWSKEHPNSAMTANLIDQAERGYQDAYLIHKGYIDTVRREYINKLYLMSLGIRVDSNFAFGKTYDLGKGWYAVFDRGEVGNQAHVHVWNKNSDEGKWIMNLDGSMSHKSQSKSGTPPNSAMKKLKEQTGFDYKKVRNNWTKNDKTATIQSGFLCGYCTTLLISYSDGSYWINPGYQKELQNQYGAGVFALPINPFCPSISFQLSPGGVLVGA